MKLLSFISATVFCLALLSWPARADEPQAIKLAPQIQAMLAELLKTADAEPAENAAVAAPAAPATPAASANPPPVLPVATPTLAPKANQPATGLATSSLTTSSLRTGGLMTSAPLGGHGMNGGTPRLTDAEWRQQFPVRK